ncbi:LytTR family transcriptional regulator DNA-binding domain-containing protein [Macrococcoides caseolyticum]|uniref:LytTR family transcriptional regulator DNA-binding domain-containing protein n=1 Tax=Macrococcoides caseolyticum TaxID=69966 RepID=UPI001F30632B|nr:LytTR family transcriptional regulator DNA-binding domain-containing protein [Macrococcus caseolyticus]MCE4956531.1 LytTR family transcriptional regulator DNA-binding domain-containing protein [Macrococcus caseolyticus]
MKILIVDDEPLARNELQYLIHKIDEKHITDEADSVEETLTALLSETYDLLFLDINLINESGLDLAQKINKMKSPPMIVFATAHDTYAVKAFELNALDYVLKPFEFNRIKVALDKANDRLSRNDTNKCFNVTVSTISVQIDDKIYVINTHDIIALFVEEGQLNIVTVNNTYTIHEPLSAFEKKLPPDKFLRIHRSSIINKNHIKSAEQWFNNTYQVKLTHDVKLQVSRSYIKQFKHEIGLN